MKQYLHLFKSPVLLFFLTGLLAMTAGSVTAQTGTATSIVSPSDAAPDVGDQITATIRIDVSGVSSPDNKLGSYTGTLNWNTAVLSYSSNTGVPSGFTGYVNTATSGRITFNGVNTSGATGNILIMTITFDVVGPGTTALDLSYSAMAAASTFKSLLGILTITDGQVTATGSGQCAVNPDGAVSSNTADDVSSISIAHTSGTGVNRLMLVGVSWNNGSSDQTISSVTFTPSGGSALPFTEVITQIVTTSIGTLDGKRYSAIYRLVNPPSGVSGTVTITFAGTVTYGIVAGAINFANVNQTTPIGASGGTGSATGSTTPGYTLTGLAGTELVVDNVFIGYPTGQTLTVGADQTQRWNASGGSTLGASSTEQATGSSVNMTWTANESRPWVIATVALNPSCEEVTYILTMSTNPGSGGTTTPTPGAHTYAAGTVVDINATPAAGYDFAGWTGSVADPGSPATTVTMDGDKTVTANFVTVPSCFGQDGAVTSNSGDDVASLSISGHTTGSGTERLMLVGVSWNCGTTDRTISSVTFTPSGGSALTLNPVKTQKAGTQLRYSAIYSLVNPPQGVTGAILITFSGSVASGIVAGVVNFAGVDQSSPLGTSAGAGATSQGKTPTVTLTGLSGKELVFDNVFIGASSESQTLTPGAGQSPLWNAFAGNVRAASSTEQASGSSVTMSWTAASSAWWAIAAVPINPSSTRVWTGASSTDWNTAANWCGGVPGAGNNAFVPSAPANQPVIQNSPAALCKDLTINPGASLTINAGRTLTVNGDLAAYGTLTIESDAVTNSGSMIVEGNSTGNVTFKRQLRTIANYGDCHYFSAPVSGQTVTGFKSTDSFPATIWEWQETNPTPWQTLSSGTFTSGRGYNLVQSGGNGKFAFTGTVVTTSPVITATAPWNSSGTYADDRANWAGGGCNLLGNPFTSALDASKFITTNTASFDPNYMALYIYDGYNNTYLYAAAAAPVDPMSGLFGSVIQAGQGFFVFPKYNGLTFTFVPKTSGMQTHNTSAELKSASTPWPGLALKVKSGLMEKSVSVVYNEKMNVGLDPGYDVGHLAAGSELEVYTALVKDNGINFVRQALPLEGSGKNTVPVGIDSEKGGEVSFSAFVNPIGNGTFYLEDRSTGTITDLSKSQYAVTLPPNTSGTGRFFIHTSASNLIHTSNTGYRLPITDYRGENGEAFRIWSSHHTIFVEGVASAKATGAVYDLIGRKIMEVRMNQASFNSFAVPSFLNGIFMVKISDEGVTEIRKVLISGDR